MAETRMPKQKRGIEKRNKIIDEGFKIICRDGFYNITVNDIAKEAGVSIGIVYQYFKDKLDIYIEGVRKYAKSTMFPLSNIKVKENFNIDDLEPLIEQGINKFLVSHRMSKKAHQELESLLHIHPEIENIFTEIEKETILKICNFFNINGLKVDNLDEKIHLSYKLVDTFSHEYIYHKHDNYDYVAMKREVIKMISSILK